jgi:non-heme chloroperoxidase
VAAFPRCPYARVALGTITVGRENSTSVELYYEDHGAGPPVVLIHGFPLDCQAWERQAAALLDTGHRVVAYDRRGFGASSRPATGYDYNTLASDLNTLITTLDLHEVVFVGHDMGTGEIVRYLSTYGSRRVSRAILISPLQPSLSKALDNPEGLDQHFFDDAMDAIRRDRAAYISGFIAASYNADVELGKRISADAMRNYWHIGMRASAKGTIDCIAAWLTDFSSDLPRIDVPVLVVAGDQDRIVPLLATVTRLEAALSRSMVRLIEGAPHGLLWTHADDVNCAILSFIDK